MIITTMTSAHISQVSALEKLCFSDPWSENSIRSELNNPLSCWLVALEDDRVTGYVGSQTVMDETDMMNIAVCPEYRRKGIAEALVQKLIALLQEKGSTMLTLEVRASNMAAQTLYQKLGFVHIGTRKNYYRHPKEDALILRKEWEK